MEFGIIIIESLREGDKKTGSILHEESIKYKKLQGPNLSSILYIVSSKAEFCSKLDEVISQIKNDNFFPILHLETHGCDDGIQLSNNDIIYWDELLSKFREINILLENRLVVYLGMCMGSSIIGNISPSDRAPFKAIIGTFKKINEDILLLAFQEFYDNFLFSFELQESIDKMNSVLDSEKPLFTLLVSDFCFDDIVNPDRDSGHFQSLVNEKAIQEKASNPEFIEKSFGEIKDIVEKRIRKILEDERQNKDYFIMKDLIERTT